VYVFTYRQQDKQEAMAIIDGLGIALTIRLGPATWKAFTVTPRKVQENSYKYDKEKECFLTQEERTVHNSWNHEIIQGRNKSHQQQVSCPIKQSTFECQGINAFKDTTILSVSSSANGSVTTATQIPADWELLSYFNSVNSAVAGNTAKEDKVDFDDVSSAMSGRASYMDTSQTSSTAHDRPPPAEIDVPKMSPPHLPPTQEEQSEAIHHLPEELKPYQVELPNVQATEQTRPPEASTDNGEQSSSSQANVDNGMINISSGENSDDDTSSPPRNRHQTSSTNLCRRTPTRAQKTSNKTTTNMTTTTTKK